MPVTARTAGRHAPRAHRVEQDPARRTGWVSGEQPASAPDIPCRVCEPVTLLSENQARQRLNWRVEQLVSATGRHGRTVNTLANDSIGVKTRKGISLVQLGAALTHVEQWLADPASMPAGRPAISRADLDQLHGAELRNLLTTYVGPLVKALHTAIPLVQLRLNDWMDAPSRAQATDELRRATARRHPPSGSLAGEPTPRT